MENPKSKAEEQKPVNAKIRSIVIMYLDIIIRSLISFFSVIIVLEIILVYFFHLNFIVVIIIAFFVSILLAPFFSKIRLGEYFLIKYEYWLGRMANRIFNEKEN